MANETTLTSLTELVPAEEISMAIGEVARSATVATVLAVGVSLTGMSPTFRLVRWDDAAVPLSESSDKTEAAAFSETEQLASESTLSAATVGIFKEPTIEVLTHQKRDLITALLMESAKAMLDQLDEDVLTNLTSATTTIDHSNTDLNVDRFAEADTSLASGEGPGDVHVAVMHETAYGDMKVSLRNQAGAYGFAQQQQFATLLNAKMKGFKGEHEGYIMLVTNNVPQYDANNWVTGLIRRSSGSGEAAAVNSGLAMGVWQPMKNELEWNPTTLSYDLVTWSIYGSCLNRQDSVRELVTSKT